MQRSPEARENEQHEMISIDGAQTFGLNGTSVQMQSSGKAISKTTDGEKSAEFRPDEMDYDKGVGKIIANQNKDLLSGEEDPKRACPVSDVVYDSLGMQHQMNLLRRWMCLMAALLLVVFLTAAASLVLSYVTATTGKTLSSDQANSSKGGEPTTCGENVSFPELKLKIDELKRALNLTGSHVKDLKTELKMQKAIASADDQNVQKRNLTVGCKKGTYKTDKRERKKNTNRILYDNAGNSYPAYCDLKSEPGTAWTLIMSWANVHRALPSFRTVPLNGNAPVNENAQNWNLYRLSLARMRSLQAHSTHWRSTCSYPTYGVDFRDYVRGNFNDFNVVDYIGSGKCMKVEYVNIRGNMGMHLTARVWQGTSHFWHISDSGCQFDPRSGTVSSEDNFGYYGTINPKFRCNEKPDSTTQWWFGAHL